MMLFYLYFSNAASVVGNHTLEMAENWGTRDTDGCLFNLIPYLDRGRLQGIHGLVGLCTTLGLKDGLHCVINIFCNFGTQRNASQAKVKSFLLLNTSLSAHYIYHHFVNFRKLVKKDFLKELKICSPGFQQRVNLLVMFLIQECNFQRLKARAL